MKKRNNPFRRNGPRARSKSSGIGLPFDSEFFGTLKQLVPFLKRPVRRKNKRRKFRARSKKKHNLHSREQAPVVSRAEPFGIVPSDETSALQRSKTGFLPVQSKKETPSPASIDRNVVDPTGKTGFLREEMDEREKLGVASVDIEDQFGISPVYLETGANIQPGPPVATAAPPGTSSKRPGLFFGWLRLPWMHATPAQSSAAALAADAMAGELPVVRAKRSNLHTATPSLAALDLDAALLAGQEPTVKEAREAKESKEAKEARGRETASPELLQMLSELPTTKKTEKVDAATARQLLEQEAKKELLQKRKKEAEEAAAKQKKLIETEKAKPAEIIFKPMVRMKRSGLRDFLGALKTIGLGHQKIALIQNLATMLDAGLPLVDSLKTLQADTRSRAGRQLQQNILDAVENGSPLWRAFDDQHCFSPDVIALVRIGEEAGNLAENMGYLASQQEKDQALKSKVKMAMIYPTIVLIIMMIIVMGLGMFVLPNLIGVLFSLNVPLPLVTRLVILFSNFFSQHGVVAIPSVAAGVLLLIILSKFTRFRRVAQWATFHIPGIGRLVREATIARFGVILGGLLQAGVPLVDALRSLAEVTSIVSYRMFYLSLLAHVTVGDSFGKSFASIHGSNNLLPASVQQLVTTGERSGSLAKILLKIADIYEKKANDTAQKLPVILEPILLLFIGALVGTIAFAIIVPIYSIVGNVGGQ